MAADLLEADHAPSASHRRGGDAEGLAALDELGAAPSAALTLTDTPSLAPALPSSTLALGSAIGNSGLLDMLGATSLSPSAAATISAGASGTVSAPTSTAPTPSGGGSTPAASASQRGPDPSTSPSKSAGPARPPSIATTTAPAGRSAARAPAAAPVLASQTVQRSPAAEAISTLGQANETGASVEASPAPTVDVGSFTGGARQVEAAGHASPPASLLDAILDQARSLLRSFVSGATSAVTGLLGELGTDVQGAIGEAWTFLSSAATELWGLVTNGVRSAIDGIQGALGAIVNEVRTHLSSAWAAIRAIPNQVKAHIQQAIMRAIRGDGNIIQNIIEPITSRVNAMVATVTGTVQAIVGRIESTIQAGIGKVHELIGTVAERANALIERITARIDQALTNAQQFVTRLTQRLTSARSGIGGLIMEAIGPIVNSIASVANQVVARLVEMARGLLESARGQAHQIVNSLRQRADTLVDRVVQLVRTTAEAVLGVIRRSIQNTIDILLAPFRLIRALAQRLFAAAGRAIMEIIKPIIAERVAPLIGPAIRQLQAIKEGAAKQLPGLAQQASNIAQNAASAVRQTGRDVLRGLLSPDGDHFGYGISWSASAEGGVGIGVTISAMLDIVFSYVHHQIGIFLSPGASVNLNAGVGESASEADFNASWGTVMTFGGNRGPGKSVNDGYGGAFVGAGVSVSVAEVVGASKGNNLYMGGRSVFGTPGRTEIPGTPGSPAVPGTPGSPGTTGTPGTPGSPSTPASPDRDIPLRSERLVFNSGADAIQEPNVTKIQGVARTMIDASNANPAHQIRAEAIGEASRRWRVVPPGKTADQLNSQLAADRARHAAAELGHDLPHTPPGAFAVASHGTGSSRATGAGATPDDNSETFRDVTLAVVEHVPGDAGQPGAPGTPGSPGTPGTPGTPGHPATPGTPAIVTNPGVDFIPPFIPDILPHLDGTPGGRPTVGDDSTVSLRLGGALDAKASLSVSNSYSVPLCDPIPFPAGAELPIRILMFIAKMANNAATGDVIGILRDSLALVGPVTEAFFGPWVDNFVDQVIPPAPPALP